MFNEKMDKKLPYISDINVAVIMDPFSYNSFKDEFNAFVLEPDNWKNIFENNKIDLFFCESVWYGITNSNIINGYATEYENYPWKDKVINSYLDKQNTLQRIINYCKKNNIPTIFWNKEDPVSFDLFIDSALMFDYIFTTDEDSIIKYKIRGHDNVFKLLFASQVKLFNPIENGNRSKDIIFAGSWYGNNFPERQEIMIDIFNKIIDSKYHLKIYDRNTNIEDIQPCWKFPNQYHQYLNPNVPFEKMKYIYKESKFSLNINSITYSSTMFSRRVFELMSSNTFVISNYSKGLENLFGDSILYLDKEDSLVIDEDKVDEICEKNLYNVLENHTYYDRFKFILDVINFDYHEKNTRLFLIYFDENYEKCIEDFNKIQYSNKICVIISNNMNLTNDSEDNIQYMDDLNKLSDLLSSEDYFLIRDLNDNLEDTFFKHALLHYKYLENNIGIQQNKDKYKFSQISMYGNVLFNSINFEKVLKKFENSTEENIKVYSI